MTSASNVPPDIEADIHSADSLREYYRQIAAEAGMGLIEADSVTIDGCPAVWVLLKAPQQPTGNTYIGSFLIPFRTGCVFFRIQCEEGKMTGTRETLVIVNKFKEGEEMEIILGEEGTGLPRGWFRDPYGAPDPPNAKILWCLSDDTVYDDLLPNHPLSRLRRQRRTLMDRATLRPKVKQLPPFVYPPELTPTKKPWWKR